MLSILLPLAMAGCHTASVGVDGSEGARAAGCRGGAPMTALTCGSWDG
jgi:hypothetical protein